MIFTDSLFTCLHLSNLSRSVEREYTRLIDTANAPIFGVDTYGRVNIWNQCAIQLVGYSTEEVMGKVR